MTGSIISMLELPFIRLNQMKEKLEDTNKGYKQKKTKSGVVRNLAIQSLFKHGMGEKFLKQFMIQKAIPILWLLVNQYT